MVVYELEKVEIDNCLICGGVWLDQGELEQLGKSDLSFVPAGTTKEDNRRCPLCGKKMQKVSFFDQVVLDRCVSGHGFWCDRGELKAILEKTMTSTPKVVGLLKEVFKAKNT